MKHRIAIAILVIIVSSSIGASEWTKRRRRQNFPRIAPGPTSDAPVSVRITRNVREGGLDLVTIDWRAAVPSTTDPRIRTLYLLHDPRKVTIHTPLRIEIQRSTKATGLTYEWIDELKPLRVGSYPGFQAVVLAEIDGDAQRVAVEFVSSNASTILTNAFLAVSSSSDGTGLDKIDMPSSVEIMA
jgi:hypothetical protein